MIMEMQFAVLGYFTKAGRNASTHQNSLSRIFQFRGSHVSNWKLFEVCVLWSDDVVWGISFEMGVWSFDFITKYHLQKRQWRQNIILSPYIFSKYTFQQATLKYKNRVDHL